MWTSQVRPTIERSLYSARAANDAEYRKTIQKLIGYFDGQHMDQLSKQIEKLFKKAETREMLKQLRLVGNLTNFVIRKTAQAYSPDPTRSLVNQNNELLPLQADFLAWSRAVKLPQKLKRAHRMAKLCGVVAIKPAVRKVSETEGFWSLDIITPDRFFVSTHPEDPMFPIAFAYCVRNQDPTNPTESWFGWDHMNYFEKEHRSTSGSSTVDATRLASLWDNPVKPNPYRRIPVVFAHADPSVEGLSPPVDDSLIAWQEAINVRLTELVHILFYQSHSTLVAYGVDGDIATGPDQVLKLSLEKVAGDMTPDAKYLTPNPNIDGVLKAINLIIDMGLQVRDINPDSFRGTNQAASGLALKLRDQALTALRDEDISYWADVEADVIDLLKVMGPYETGALPRLNIPADAIYKTTFAPVSVPDTPEAEYNLNREKVLDGVKSVGDLVREEYPELDTPEKIEAHLSAVRDMNQKYPLADAPVSPGVTLARLGNAITGN